MTAREPFQQLLEDPSWRNITWAGGQPIGGNIMYTNTVANTTTYNAADLIGKSTGGTS